MNDTQSRLAALLKAGVGDPPARVTVRAVRRQMARRRGAAAVGAAVAIAAVAAIGAGLSGRLGHPSPGVSPAVSAAPAPCRAGWHVAPGAAPAGDHEDLLVAIAGSASDDLWAVGTRFPGSNQAFPLLEHWDGRRWTYSAGAALGGRQGFLTSVAALAPDDVWAVGNFLPVGSSQAAGALIEHWDGRSWSLQRARAFTGLKAALPLTRTLVVAPAPNDVWVLSHGSYGSSIYVYLHWNGTSWKIFPGPRLISPRVGTAAMQAIGTDRFGHLWAVGGRIRGFSEAGVPSGGVVARWNGRRWEVQRRLAWTEPLTMVAPVGPDDVWAIAGGGVSTEGTYGVSPVTVLHWNGRTWNAELSRGSTNSVHPTGLLAVSADDVYVIGRGITTQRPVIDHWDGARWRRVRPGPTGHVQPLRSIGLTVTSNGSIAALDTEGIADRVNFLWLRCP